MMDFAAKAAELNGCGDECGDQLCRDARVRIENALAGAYVAAMVEVASEAQRHADFLEHEARNGGNAPYLRARREEAIYLRNFAARKADPV